MLRRLNNKSLLFFCFIFLTKGAFSAGSSLIPFGLRPVLSLITGASITTPGQKQTLMPVDLCHYSYSPNSSDNTQGVWGGFLGAELNYNKPWAIVAGVGYYQPSAYNATGILSQGADVASANAYQYRYKTKNQQLLVEGRAVLMNQGQIQPFVMAGIGASFNRMYQYENNVPVFYEFTPSFGGHTKTSFTYSVGPGVDLSITQSFRVGVSYRFSDLGSANTAFGKIDGIPFNYHLKQTHLYANQLLAQFTFIPWNS